MSTTAGPFLAAPVEGGATPRLVAQMRVENDALVNKLALLARATRGLAGDLAIARRDGRVKQQQIDALRTENARLRACVHPSLRTAGGGQVHVG